jgi:pyruvate, orthophosphate dikinase
VAARPRTPRSSRARSASRASPAAPLVIDYGTRSAKVNGLGFSEGEWISLDGTTGEVFVGALPTVEVRFEDQAELQKILEWADRARRLQVWTNADKPEEAAMARRYGAQGIGLCRTEHMFREGERLDIVRDAILVAFQATRAKERREAGETLSADDEAAVARFDEALGKLEQLQQGDFEGIFEAMDGLPVVVRLIDPPLHEFLPNHAEVLVEVTRMEATGTCRRTTRSTSRRARCCARSRRCASRTRCSACAAAASG